MPKFSFGCRRIVDVCVTSATSEHQGAAGNIKRFNQPSFPVQLLDPFGDFVPANSHRNHRLIWPRSYAPVHATQPEQVFQ
jgi:hypothetical protein